MECYNGESLLSTARVSIVRSASSAAGSHMPCVNVLSSPLSLCYRSRNTHCCYCYYTLLLLLLLLHTAAAAQGEMIHNFADGVLIGAAFLSCSSATGWTVTTAIIAHELPQEVSDYIVYRAGGCSLAQALAFNFASALTAVLGGVLILALGTTGSMTRSDFGFILMASAGFLLYTAAGGLLPGRTTAALLAFQEVHK
jgi:ZIP Zinc transporter